MADTWNYLLNEVIKPGLCTQCGSCIGLAQANWNLKKTSDPTPQLATKIMNYQKLVDSPAQQGIVRTQNSIRVPLENS